MAKKRIVIVGGVAGGASAAARARRLSEDAEIIVLERGPYVSFANCGLPYYVGGEIAERGKLLPYSPEGLRERFNLDVRTHAEVVRIDREARAVDVRDLETGRTYREPYDALVLSPGAAPALPPLPGARRDGHFQVRTVPHVDAIDAWIRAHDARRAVVVGGGYIGLEMAEQLHRRGLSVALIEALPQVMAPLDPEMAAFVHDALRAQGIALMLGARVARFDDPEEGAAASTVCLESGERLPADLVVLAVGVKPEVELAREAGLETGDRGGIRVDATLRTSDPHIYAVGDAIEVRDRVTGQWAAIPLAGPANRQGRMAADHIFGREARYEGTWGTAILRVFELAAGCTGANERALRQAGIPYKALHVHPSSHAGYFPGAHPLSLKLLFSPKDGRILGVQAVGKDGVDKRVDVVATAMQTGATVHDLGRLELSYAPPFGSARDPVNILGMAAANILDGLTDVRQWYDLAPDAEGKPFVLDVRNPEERERGAIPDSVFIPLNDLRARLGELPQEREIVVYCHSGQRSYYATRVLREHGLAAYNLSGAYKTWSAMYEPETETAARD